MANIFTLKKRLITESIREPLHGFGSDLGIGASRGPVEMEIMIG